jgi:hypothetical protein
LEGLLSNIHGLKVTRTAEVEIPFDAEVMKSQLIELKDAIGVLDGGTMDRAVENLLHLTRTTDANAVIRKIADNILISEYDEAIALIEGLYSDTLEHFTN